MAKQTRIRVEEPMVQGAVSCETGADWIKPWRLPFDALKLFPPEDGLVALPQLPGLRLVLDEEKIEATATLDL